MEDLKNYRLGMGTMCTPISPRELDRADNNKPHIRVLGGNYYTITAVYPLLTIEESQALLAHANSVNSIFEWRDTYTNQLYSVLHSATAPNITYLGNRRVAVVLTLEGEPIDG